MQFCRRMLFPLFFLVFCPPAAILFWYTNVALGGSVLRLFELMQRDGIYAVVSGVWGPIFFGTKIAWSAIAIFAAFQLLLMKILPGRQYAGPITPKGNIPYYKSNGLAAFCITLFAFYFASDFFQLFPASIIYDNFGPIISSLNIFSLCFCLFLFIKGKVKPSSSDSGSTGNFLFDFFWGMELYPRIFGWDVKMFTNCRFGMMSWALIILSFAAKQRQVYGLSDALFVSVALQLVYIAKFFLWESGYMRSMDIMHDRAGFMICWGCLVWVPAFYTLPTLYLVNHPHHLGTATATAIFALGFLAIAINYLADRQRQKVRATNGECRIWRKKPELIVANYVTTQGEAKQSVLLASGWWGLSRHFHYLPEIAAAFFWALPALFDHAMPYFYVLFLTALLMDRAFRHERRCAAKYGEQWKEYCSKVPYKIIPFIY